MTLEEGYIVRRCKQRDCRLLAMHPAKLWITPAGTLRVTLRCLKCREAFGGGVKPHEWRYLRVRANWQRQIDRVATR